MSEVEIGIGGRTYRVGCAPGEEERVQLLAGRIDAEASVLRQQMGSLPEVRTLLMASLMLADKLDEIEAERDALAAEAAEAAAASAPPPEPKATRPATDLFGIEREDEVAERMNGLAAQIEGLLVQMRRGQDG